MRFHFWNGHWPRQTAIRNLIGLIVLLANPLACTQADSSPIPMTEEASPMPDSSHASSPDPSVTPATPPDSEQEQLATFGAGCFWCVEAIFQQLQGVTSVVSGYSGGRTENPTYRQVSTGRTGHAEVCQIRFNPQIISFDALLRVFWETHDPTTLNRQGADVGTQYRSVIFYHNEEQRRIAEERKKQLEESGSWSQPIVTEISPMTTFYPAEEYHQNYYIRNPQQAYCQVVIRPKLEKFREVFREKLRTDD